MKRGLVFALVFCALTASAQAPVAREPVVELNPEQTLRAQQFARELRCLVCQNETIADSTAPLAADLRTQVNQQIASGKTDAEIIQYLTDRYGDYVLYRPRFNADTLLLWLGPFLLLGIGLIAAVLHVRKSGKAKTAATPVVDSAALARVLQASTSNRDEPRS